MRVPGLGRAWPFLTAATFLGSLWAVSASGAGPDQPAPNDPSSVTNAISLVSRSAGRVPAKTGPPALPSAKLRGHDERRLFPAGRG